jgi:prolyl oligopeptidase
MSLGPRLSLVALPALLLACGGSVSAPARPSASHTAAPVATASAAPAPAKAVRGDPPQGPTRRDGTADVLFGTTVADPYRWLEDSSRDEVRAWVDKQNAYTRSYLDARGGHARIEAAVQSLLLRPTLDVPEPRARGKGERRYFRASVDWRDGQPALLMRDGPRAAERTAVAPASLFHGEGLVTLSYWAPSPDGSLVAYGVSEGGQEEDTLLVRDVEQQRDLPLRVEGANNASIAWLPRGDGFYYTRLPPLKGTSRSAEDLRGASVHFHKMGQAEGSDAKIDLGKDRANEPRLLRVSPDGQSLIVLTPTAVHVLDTRKNAPRAGSPLAFTGVFDAWPADDQVVVRTYEGAARGKLVAVPYAHLDKKSAKDLVKESTDLLDEVRAFGKSFLLTYKRTGGLRLVRVSQGGKDAAEITPPGNAAFTGKVSVDPGGEEAFLQANAPSGDRVVYRLDGATSALSEWERAPGPKRVDGLVKERLWARSKDGTAVPVDVYHKKGLGEDGKTPTILFGYGGFSYNALEKSSGYAGLADLGLTIAISGLRGGSEFGPSWHASGMLANKQHTFDDAIAVAELLVARRYTDPAYLGVIGASNGGLLVGALVTQRPDLFRAAVCENGLLDMVRYPRFGIAKLWFPEYGNPDKPAELGWLLGYSPYHHVKDDTAYPAVLFTASDNDPRVDPSHARKMAAALQAATSSGRPILLREDRVGGHGVNVPNKAAEVLTDALVFLTSEIGLPEPR